MSYTDLIKHIDFELSSICNAKCPVCPRLIDGQLTNFVQSYYTFEETKKIFDEDLIKNLDNLTICGNFGDGMGNPDILEILSWFKSINNKLNITISTNGSIGKTETYIGLAKIGVNMIFGIDGFGDKNQLYRVNTKWNNIVKNITSFSDNCKNGQLKVQFIAWAETTDQILPLIDFLKTLNCDLWIRKPFTHYGGITKVYNNKGKPSHVLTEISYDPFFELFNSFWSNNELDILKEKIIKMKIPVVELIKLKNDHKMIISREINKYEYDQFEFTDNEKTEVDKIKIQTCQSYNSYNPEDLTNQKYYLYITHDKYLMPCCMIPPYISTSINYHSGREENRQKEILNKMFMIGLDEFSLKNKTIREIFDNGVIHKFIYNNFKNPFQYCKLMCGKC